MSRMEGLIRGWYSGRWEEVDEATYPQSSTAVATSRRANSCYSFGSKTGIWLRRMNGSTTRRIFRDCQMAIRSVKIERTHLRAIRSERSTLTMRELHYGGIQSNERAEERDPLEGEVC